MPYTGTYKHKDEEYLKEVILKLIPNEPYNVGSKQLASYTGLKSRDVRLLIQKLRDDGNPICATPQDGYWIARTSDDMKETLAKMKSHIFNCKDTYNALIKCQNQLKQQEGNDEYSKLLV